MDQVRLVIAYQKKITKDCCINKTLIKEKHAPLKHLNSLFSIHSVHHQFITHGNTRARRAKNAEGSMESPLQEGLEKTGVEASLIVCPSW